jgi:lysophosphatidylcholine acyltransferase/lyso-PAF acetyltransferase
MDARPSPLVNLMSPHSQSRADPSPAGYGATSVPGSGTSVVSTRLQQATINPFRYNYRQHMGALQLIKMIIVGLTLFPIRIVVLIISLVLMTVSAKIRILCNDPGKGVPIKAGWFSFWCLRFGSRLFMWSMGFWWITVDDRRLESDRHASQTKPPIIVANHCSFFDAFYFAWSDGPMGVGKQELFNIPIIGAISKATQMIGVSRDDKTKSHNAAEEIKRRTRWEVDQPQSVLDEQGHWPPLLIFPEATCTNTRSIIQFKIGAFLPMMPVSPVTLDFRQKHLDLAWVDTVNPGLTMLRAMCQVYNRLHVTYLPVIRPSLPNQNINTPAQFAQVVRNALARHLNVPTTEHNFLDTLLVREVGILRLPRDAINVEMGRYDSDKSALLRVKEALQHFAKVDRDKDGFINESDFAAMLGFDTEAERVAHGTLITAAFSHWDRDGDGKINFHEFLLLSSAIKVSKLTQQYQLQLEEKRGNSPSFSNAEAPPAGGVAIPVLPAGGGKKSTKPASPSSSTDSTPPPPDADTAAPGLTVGGVVGPGIPVREAMKQEGEGVLEPINDDLRNAFALSFTAFDTDHDGIINMADFVSIIQKSAPSVSLSEARALFHAAAWKGEMERSQPIETDTDTVNFEQYMRLCERHPVLVGSLLDAVALGDGLRSKRDATEEEAIGDEEPDLEAISRHNTFISEPGSVARLTPTNG